MQIQKRLSMAVIESLAVDRLRHSELCSTTARALQSVKALFPVGGARSATQQKGSKMGDCIFTFGYEGLPLEAFIGRLKVTGVQAVLDVRANPLSRKPGFSKTALSTALHEVGIIYAHVPAMGCPKPVRDRCKRDGDWAAYTRRFLAHLEGQTDAVAGLARASRDARHHASFALRPTLTAAIAPTSPELPSNLLASKSYISRSEQRSLTGRPARLLRRVDQADDQPLIWEPMYRPHYEH